MKLEFIVHQLRKNNRGITHQVTPLGPTAGAGLGVVTGVGAANSLGVEAFGPKWGHSHDAQELKIMVFCYV